MRINLPLRGRICGNKQNPSKWGQTEVTYSEWPQGSWPPFLVFVETQRQESDGEALLWKKEKTSGRLSLEAVGMGSYSRLTGSQPMCILCDWFGEHIWLSMLGPDLEIEAEIKEASSYWPSPDHSGPIPTEVVGQSSFVIYGLAIICLYMYIFRFKAVH